MQLREFVYNKNSEVTFDFYRAGIFYYRVWRRGTTEYYIFPVPVDDIGNATLLWKDKAITYMRWIRKAIEENTMVKTTQK